MNKVRFSLFARNVRLFVFLFLCFLTSCKDEYIYTEEDRFIQVNNNINVINGTIIKDPIFNLVNYDDFLRRISSDSTILIVPSKDFDNTFSQDKKIITLRYDVDWDIKSALRFAYREYKYGIKSSYYILHTAGYYGMLKGKVFERNKDLLAYLEKIQNGFGQEIGFHNDLITLQVVYGISAKGFLRTELEYLRSNGIEVTGTTYHGSKYNYIYKYGNADFWLDYHDNKVDGYIVKGVSVLKLEKDYLKNYDLEYEGGLLKTDYFFSDVDFSRGVRWNMSMVNLDTIRPGKKIIILLHPEYWN